ncbi:hypothetical protein [Falsirhodobacter deserti]|uniref:hypothetical protein n=1 Tax=Falsirhodobacter deserti TaxID=1365611 RepID=UPI000FE3AB74|nr:hypothetical protein [Falsirhodobacter deserti]
MRVLLLLAPLLILGACSGVSNPFRAAPAERPAPATTTSTASAVVGQSAARSVESYDLTSEAERQRALSTPADAGADQLGQVVVALGNAAEPGFWLRSSLVKQPQKGRVETAGGQSVAVDLLPGAGSAQLSLAAYRALGLGLTDLPQITVYGG